jgi:hypothetical protein
MRWRWRFGRLETGMNSSSSLKASKAGLPPELVMVRGVETTLPEFPLGKKVELPCWDPGRKGILTEGGNLGEVLRRGLGELSGLVHWPRLLDGGQNGLEKLLPMVKQGETDLKQLIGLY